MSMPRYLYYKTIGKGKVKLFGIGVSSKGKMPLLDRLMIMLLELAHAFTSDRAIAKESQSSATISKSSANIRVEATPLQAFNFVSRDYVYTLNKRGDEVNPWGTPLLQVEVSSPSLTLRLFSKNRRSWMCGSFNIALCLRDYMRMRLSTLSYADLKSTNAAIDVSPTFLLSVIRRQSLRLHN